MKRKEIAPRRGRLKGNSSLIRFLSGLRRDRCRGVGASWNRFRWLLGPMTKANSRGDFLGTNLILLCPVNWVVKRPVTEKGWISVRVAGFRSCGSLIEKLRGCSEFFSLYLFLSLPLSKLSAELYELNLRGGFSAREINGKYMWRTQYLFRLLYRIGFVQLYGVLCRIIE